MHSTPWQGEIFHPGTASLNLCAQVRNWPVYSALHRAYPQELFGFGRQENLKQDRCLFLIYVKVWTDVGPKAGIMSLCVRDPRSLHILLLCPHSLDLIVQKSGVCVSEGSQRTSQRNSKEHSHTLVLKQAPRRCHVALLLTSHGPVFNLMATTTYKEAWKVQSLPSMAKCSSKNQSIHQHGQSGQGIWG